MNSDKRTPGKILDSGTEAMRNDTAPADQIEQAAARVFRTLQAEHAKVVQHPASLAANRSAGSEAQGIDRIQSCDDFRALIPAYLSASLTPSRRLLFEDHTHECVLCRKALEQAGRRPVAGAGTLKSSERRRSGNSRWIAKWAAAAAVAAGVVLALQTTAIRDFIWPIDVHAMVQTVEGGLYRVKGQQVQPIAAGQRVERSELVRTGNSSGAILELADGSRIEMNARSEISLDRARDGVRINLNRGRIIVTAAKQKSGHLYAATKELGVSVVGTVFEVNAGVKGSRVTVIEGEVRVQQGQAVQPLRPGQQLSTDPGMGMIPVHEEISWSRDVAKYLELLRIGQDAANQLAAIEMRHTSDLVPLVPESTVVFASLPNVTQTIAQSYALLKQRLTDNQVLSDWWQQQNANASIGGWTIDQIVQQLTRAGSYLGPEVIVAFPKDLDTQAPVVLADVTSHVQFVTALQDAGIRVVLSAEQLQALPRSGGPVVFVGQGLMIISDANQVLRSLAFRAQSAPNSFASTQLYGRLAQAYSDGVGWLLAADLERLIGDNASNSDLQQLGIADMQQFIAEQKTGAGGGSYQATLGFKQNRRGMASWLAPASPMGALEFISPNAFGVASVVTKDPSSMFEDIFNLVSAKNGAAAQDLQNFEAQHRVDIRRDLVATLGNEVLFAVDGPILPTPAWRMVIEVNDAARLQTTIEASVADMNREAAARQQQGAQIASETVGGRTFYSLTGANFPTEIHYSYWMGYMIIAPSRAMVMESIQNHDTGNTLLRSAAFRSQLPADGRDYASGFVYQNIEALTSALPAGLPVDALKQASVNAIPSLVCFYGEPDRIVMSSKGVLGMNIANVAGLTGLLNVAGVKGIH